MALPVRIKPPAPVPVDHPDHERNKALIRQYCDELVDDIKCNQANRKLQMAAVCIVVFVLLPIMFYRYIQLCETLAP